jgi:hypothetical protein
MTSHPVTDIGSRLELFVDDTLIDSLSASARLQLHQPVAREISMTFEKPWEGNMCAGYKTYFWDVDRFRMYYQSWKVELVEADGKAKYKPGPIYIGYAESTDGIHWHKPSLGLHEINGSKDNNICFVGFGEGLYGIHGFAPFKDTRPGVPADELYKALGAPESFKHGYKLFALKSPDGLNWSYITDQPVITDGKFDSQNLAFWDEQNAEYRAYIRDFDQDKMRGIKTCSSKDFVNWTDPVWLDYFGKPVTQLYTNQIMPYPRAPHILLGFPARYVEQPWNDTVEALPELEHRKRRASASNRYGTAVTDSLLIAGRDRLHFKRWDEAFMRPGLRPVGSWCYGDCYIGWGLLNTKSEFPGAPDELSLYATEGYWREGVNAIRRYTIRVDGFVSLTAPLTGGELVTKPVTFKGDRLMLNLSTSAAGRCRVELQNPDKTPIPGFTMDESIPLMGDSLSLQARWTSGQSLASLAGKPVRIRFVLGDADLYSYQFI